jgi:hypothetical protein
MKDGKDRDGRCDLFWLKKWLKAKDGELENRPMMILFTKSKS